MKFTNLVRNSVDFVKILVVFESVLAGHTGEKNEIVNHQQFTFISGLLLQTETRIFFKKIKKLIL